jgi:hypothetical protein
VRGLVPPSRGVVGVSGDPYAMYFEQSVGTNVVPCSRKVVFGNLACGEAVVLGEGVRGVE